MANSVVVDTDILIDAGRGISEAVDCIRQLEQQTTLAVSIISQMELIIGCRNKAELRTVEHFLQRFQILKVNEQVSDLAVDLLRRYRLSHGLLIADSLIAATVLSSGASFITKNQGDFRFIKGLALLAYP